MIPAAAMDASEVRSSHAEPRRAWTRPKVGMIPALNQRLPVNNLTQDIPNVPPNPCNGIVGACWDLNVAVGVDRDLRLGRARVEVTLLMRLAARLEPLARARRTPLGREL